MDEIELWSGTSRALVSMRGAWLTNLSDEYGDILYPKRVFTTGEGARKDRGGCHVCLPNFGPGGASGQPQHGFGRLMDWEIIEQGAAHVVLRLAKGKDGYASLQSTLRYELNRQSCRMTLTLTNTGRTPLRIAPAFHPYLMAGETETVEIEGVKYRMDELAEMQLLDGVDVISLGRRKLTASADGLFRWALWTDQLGKYVCVEPTMDGNAFLQDEPQSQEVLGAGEQRVFSYELAWS